jgi:carbon-monoxide dehydrogenase large subunit
MAKTYIGASIKRREDIRFITGTAVYADDIKLPGMLHAAILRSSRAHARIRSIDTAGARAVRGVAWVFTLKDIGEMAVPVPMRMYRVPGLERYLQPLLAVAKVRYVGEPITVAVAESRYVAEDALDAIEVEYEDLPEVIDMRAALRNEVLVHEESGTNLAAVHEISIGDAADAFQKADYTRREEFSVHRHTGNPMETRGLVADFKVGKRELTVYGMTKLLHYNRQVIASFLGLPEHNLHFIENDIGGGFGIRGELYPEDFLIPFASMRLGRPVKWIEDRREHLICANHSRQQLHKIRAAVDAQGTILAIDDVFFHDQGAYVRTHATRVAMMTCGILPGPYRVPAYRSVGYFRLTNKTPAATYRAPGRYETTFVRERLVDAIAQKLGIDPIEVRRRNAITSAEMPYARPLEALGEEIHYDSGDYLGLLDKVLQHADWEKLKADLKRRRAAGELVGAGLAMFVEKSGLGPSDGAKVSVDTSGAVEVMTGGASLGQGFETVIAQVCAQALGVEYRRVRVIHGQTDKIAHGIGAHASRATVMTGSATHNAALKVRAKALEFAAERLQAPVDALDIVNGQVVRADRSSGPSIGLGEIAAALAPTKKSRGAREPGLAAEGWFHVEHQVYPYGSHLAVVRVDRGTGGVTIERYLIGYDIGRAINPMLVKGQIVGGFTQGLGGALLEEFVYSERGDPLSVTFADYLLPTVRETPNVEIILTEEAPSPLNPLGIKGAGESGITGVGAAIASAIDDAIGMPGAVTRLPITPQRLKALLDRQS